MEEVNKNDTGRSDDRQHTYNSRDAIAKMAGQYAHIRGWGIDADPDNEPTYPIKHYTGADHDRLNYERPSQQPVDVEVLHSNERPTVSAVFGTVSPPSGLSGALRRFAFRYSEESLKHWFALVLADRINVVEGIVEDIKDKGVPDIFSEMGWGAEWKYNKKGVVKKVVITAAVTAALVWYFKSKDGKRKG